MPSKRRFGIIIGRPPRRAAVRFGLTRDTALIASCPILKDRYEVIVIGAGIGGLAAAAVLASEGLDVLVVERAAQPGGCCSSFRIADFTFDAAASILTGFGTVGFNVGRSLFDFLGEQADLIPRESAYVMYFGENRIEFHRDRHAFTAELGALFPQQAGTLFSFLRELERIYEAVIDCGGPPRPRGEDHPGTRASLLWRHPASVRRLARYAKVSAEKVFSKHSDDPLARAFFDADLTFRTGYRLSELSSPVAAVALIDRHIGGTHHAIGSAQQIPDRLEKSVTEKGGCIAYRTSVEEVLVEGGTAAGVRLADGRTVTADTIISNVSAHRVFTDLLPRSALSESAIQWLNALCPSASMFSIHMGLDEESLPEGLHPSTVLVDDVREPGRFITVSVPSLFDPYLSPEGFHTVTIQAVTDPGMWPRPVDPEYGTDSYESKKQEEAASILQRVKQRFPDFEMDPVIWRLASPTTFERVMARDRGMAAAPYPGGTLPPASLSPTATEIDGLFLAGDSTYYGRGVAEAAASGIAAATSCMRHLSLKPPSFAPRESFVLETVPVRPEIDVQAVVDSVSAVTEAHRCLRCAAAPCSGACPASVDIPNMVRKVGITDFAGAARMVRHANPFGKVCGVLCPAQELCEGACVRAVIDGAVKISQLEEFVCSVAPGPEGWPEPHRGPRKAKVAVIGSGPAGLSCACCLSLSGFAVELFEQGIEAGGLPASAMPDFKLSRQLLESEVEGSLTSGVRFRGNTVFGEDTSIESLLAEGFRAVFLGVGLQRMNVPSVRGWDLPGAIDALSFLNAARRKVKREMSLNVAVIGESNLAVDTALLARELEAENVYLVMRRPVEACDAPAGRFEDAEIAGVTVIPDRRLIEVQGEGRVEGLRTHAGVGAPSREGAAAVPAVLEVGTVIVAADREIDPALGGYLASHLDTGPSGLIEVDEDMMTSIPGVFAGGDVVSGGGLVVDAVAHGRRAAIAIARYLESVSRDAAEPGVTLDGTPGPIELETPEKEAS